MGSWEEWCVLRRARDCSHLYISMQIIMVRLQRVTFLALHNYLGLTTELFNPVSAAASLCGPMTILVVGSLDFVGVAVGILIFLPERCSLPLWSVFLWARSMCWGLGRWFHTSVRAVLALSFGSCVFLYPNGLSGPSCWHCLCPALVCTELCWWWSGLNPSSPPGMTQQPIVWSQLVSTCSSSCGNK